MAVAALCCCTRTRNGQFQDRNRPLTWVELRGVEPLTSCMPYRPLVPMMVYDVLIHHDGHRVRPGWCGMVATEDSYRLRPHSDLAILPTGAD
jgi:hypothetical protein